MKCLLVVLVVLSPSTAHRLEVSVVSLTDTVTMSTTATVTCIPPDKFRLAEPEVCQLLKKYTNSYITFNKFKSSLKCFSSEDESMPESLPEIAGSLLPFDGSLTEEALLFTKHPIFRIMQAFRKRFWFPSDRSVNITVLHRQTET